MSIEIDIEGVTWQEAPSSKVVTMLGYKFELPTDIHCITIDCLGYVCAWTGDPVYKNGEWWVIGVDCSEIDLGRVRLKGQEPKELKFII